MGLVLVAENLTSAPSHSAQNHLEERSIRVSACVQWPG